MTDLLSVRKTILKLREERQRLADASFDSGPLAGSVYQVHVDEEPHQDTNPQKKPNPKNAILPVSMDQKTKDKIIALADQAGVSRSAIVREMLKFDD